MNTAFQNQGDILEVRQPLVKYLELRSWSIYFQHFIEIGKGENGKEYGRKKEVICQNVKNIFQGFPGGAVVKNPPANAGDTSLSPGLGRSHMPRSNKPMRHSYWACALEPTSHNHWSPRTYSPCFTTREATAMRSLCTTTKNSPRSPQLEESPHATVKKTQRSQKLKKKIFFPVFFKQASRF